MARGGRKITWGCTALSQIGKLLRKGGVGESVASPEDLLSRLRAEFDSDNFGNY